MISIFMFYAIAAADPASYQVVVNLPERVLRVYPADVRISDLTPPLFSYQIAIGTRKHPTPVMTTAVTEKTTRPAWHAPRKEWAGEHAGKVIPFESEDNPFRAINDRGSVEGYFISLSDGVGFHSTSQRRSIGRLASHGCIRMKLSDVKKLYADLPVGTPVRLVYDLYRVERDTDGLRIRAFEDVYKKFSEEEKHVMLMEHLASQGIPVSMLLPGEIDRVLAADSGRPAAPARVTLRLSPSPAAVPEKIEAPARPIRTISPVLGILSRDVVIVNFP